MLVSKTECSTYFSLNFVITESYISKVADTAVFLDTAARYIKEISQEKGTDDVFMGATDR